MSRIDRNTWRTVRLGEVCEIVSGGTPATHVAEYWGGDIPWLSVVDFNTGNKYVTETEKSITEPGLQNSSTHLLNTNEIIISARGTVGVLSVLAKPMAFNQSCFGLRVDSSVCDSDFLYYAMNASIAQMRQNSTMGVFSALTYQGLKSLSFQLPPHKTQHQISHSLSVIDVHISSLRRLIAKQEAIKKSTLKLLMTPKEGWLTARLEEICPLQRGFDLPHSDFIPGKYPVVCSNGIVGYNANYMVKGPGVVTGRSGTIGKVQYLEDDFWPHNTTLWVTKFINSNPKFIYHFLENMGINRFADGTGVPTLNRNNLHQLSISLPDISEQKKIVWQLDSLNDNLQELIKNFQKANILKQGMMKFFFGN